VHEVCNSLRNVEDKFNEQKDRVSIDDLILSKTPEKLQKKSLRFYRSSMDYYASIYRILSSKEVKIECLRRVSRILKLYIRYMHESIIFSTSLIFSLH